MENNLMTIQHFQDIGWSSPSFLGFSKKVLLREVEAESVLDIGCGDGLLLKELLNKGKVKRAVGLDASPNALDLAKKNGIDCRIFNIVEPLPFSDNSFDTVLLIDVMEHLFEPELVLKEAVRIAKNNVFISVPNFNSLPARIQMLLGKIPENNSSRKGHVYWFNYDRLSEILKRSGLRIEKKYFNTFEPKIINNIFLKLFPGLFSLSFVLKTKKWK